jgi:hypothetical protein
MKLLYSLRAAHAVLANQRSGPSLFEVCDPLLKGSGGGDAHLRRFYKTAVANPALRLLLRRAGLPQLLEEGRLRAVQDAIRTARDAAAPDWGAIAKPVASLIDEFPQQHAKRPPRTGPVAPLASARIDDIIQACAGHLLRSFARRGFIPAYASFNLIGDPDVRGRDFIAALQGLNARTYKNATLLFNLARVFLLANAPAVALVNPPWRGVAEPLWQPVQIRHRSAYYDAFFVEALLDFLGSGLASAQDATAARAAIDEMVRFCLQTSREETVLPHSGARCAAITALAPPPHARMNRFFWRLKSDLGFGLYVPDCDTTACSFSAAIQSGSQDQILLQPLPDLFAAYQVDNASRRGLVTVPLNDNLEFEGGVATWLENVSGDRPFGNDLDPTLNLDVLEVSFRNHARWQIAEDPRRLEMLRAVVRFERRLAASGAFADPRSHIYYLPELYCAYFGRCYQAFRAMPRATRETLDLDGSFELIRSAVIAYVRDDLMSAEMNAFDAALALLALAKLDAGPEAFPPALDCIARGFGEGSRGAPFKAYEWNKMKIPTRILVGGPEVTSAFVLSALVHARRTMKSARSASG